MAQDRRVCVCVCARVAAGRVPQAGFKPSFPRLPNEELWERGNRGWGVKGECGGIKERERNLEGGGSKGFTPKAKTKTRRAGM